MNNNRPNPTNNRPEQTGSYGAAPRHLYRYLVSYLSPNAGGFGYGNVDIHLAKKVRSRADVDYLTRLLREQGLNNPVVLGFSLYADEAPETRRTR